MRSGGAFARLGDEQRTHEEWMMGKLHHPDVPRLVDGASGAENEREGVLGPAGEKAEAVAARGRRAGFGCASSSLVPSTFRAWSTTMCWKSPHVPRREGLALPASHGGDEEGAASGIVDTVDSLAYD